MLKEQTLFLIPDDTVSVVRFVVKGKEYELKIRTLFIVAAQVSKVKCYWFFDLRSSESRLRRGSQMCQYTESVYWQKTIATFC